MDDSEVTTALRLGWELAEARGRSWPLGPRPKPDDEFPESPANVLPLRFQRDQRASRTETISTLRALAEKLRIENAASLPESLKSSLEEISEKEWGSMSQAFKDTDAYIQDQLAQRNDGLANAYLLGRGLSECFWGMARQDDWANNPGASPAFLLGEPRREELGRMLGRLKDPSVDPQTPAAIDGTLTAWHAVVANEKWVRARDLEASLYEQARVWYQLLVLGQDPSTLVRPGARLSSMHYFGRTLRAYLPQLLLGVVALALTTVAVSGKLGDPKALLPSGLGALGLAGILTRGQNLAQQLRVRLHQDSYTDLVSLYAVRVPKAPPDAKVLDLERLVRHRLLTPPTSAPPASSANGR